VADKFGPVAISKVLGSITHLNFVAQIYLAGPMETDSDLLWLRAYAPPKAVPALQDERIIQLIGLLDKMIASRRLPFTVGLFGGWGSGKTTLLSIMANRILAKAGNNRKVIYFNAWKYAGFMEIVPSLIYKVLKYGNYASKDAEEAIKEIMVSLGKEYSDTFGEWAEARIGVNPVKLFKGASKVYSAIHDGVEDAIPREIIDAYYTQIDRAQDLLAKTFADQSKVTIVMIDELDRCDPDEAFSVIKQLRVFFTMRNIPIAFIICANAEPIGLAIKHKYGLNTAFSDYESRRILEKFVDIYIDLSESIILNTYVEWLWEDLQKNIGDYALIPNLDAAYVQSDFLVDVERNATALQAMTTDNPFYGNLRLLRKTLERVCTRTFTNSHMLWTAWHLELAAQMDPAFRREIGWVSSDIEFISTEAHTAVLTSPVEWENSKLKVQANRNGTLFGLYRSAFWESSKKRLTGIEGLQDPESAQRGTILRKWMANYRAMDFIILLTLRPASDPISRKADGDSIIGCKDLSRFLQKMMDEVGEFGYLLASY
jgi:hypothetical protein